MAAIIKAANAKIRSNKVLDYVCSTRTFEFSKFSHHNQPLCKPPSKLAAVKACRAMSRRGWEKDTAVRS